METADLATGLASLQMDGASDGGIIVEVRSRHGHSAQPESQQVIAVLQAVLEVIQAEGMSTTPTTIFAALMSALDRQDAQNSSETTLAMCTLLGVALSRVPNSVLRSKFVGSIQVLSRIVEKNRPQAAAVKAALHCLGQVLAAVEPGSWMAAAPAFVLLISFTTDSRPKVPWTPAGAGEIAPELASVFQAREDLRGIVASVLIRLCKQAKNVAVLAANGGLEASAKTLEGIRQLGLVSPEARGHISDALSVYASISDPLAVKGLYEVALRKYAKVVQQHVLGGVPLLQKRCYRVLCYITTSRPDWLSSNLAAVLELLLKGSATALSPAKRYRLRLVDEGLVVISRGLGSGAGARAGAADELQVNKKTRTAAYQLLVDIAHELDHARPLDVSSRGAGSEGSDDDAAVVSDDDDDVMDYGSDAVGSRRQPSGGLMDFVTAVMAGLAGASPHMQAASVLALARLVFEFAGVLEGVVSRLLPAVLLLFRSQSREVVKAVLGFIKVRVILERLVRRCGVEPVAAACPAGDQKLLSHIRKQQNRKERRRAMGSEGGSQEDAKTTVTRHNSNARNGGGHRGGKGGSYRLAADAEAADPQDLLEAATARQLVRSAAGGGGGAAAGGGGSVAAAAAKAAAEFPRGDDGRLVIKQGELEDEFGWTKKRKRKRRDDDLGFGNDDDSDMDDMRGIAGLKAAVASVANAKSVRFKSKSGAAGDVKGKAAVDPYAYWQFDRKMLNRRKGKQAAASKGLGGIVAGAKSGALKGGKAKRAAAAAGGKRARRS
eukprot:gene11429-11575_t